MVKVAFGPARLRDLPVIARLETGPINWWAAVLAGLKSLGAALEACAGICAVSGRQWPTGVDLFAYRVSNTQPGSRTIVSGHSECEAFSISLFGGPLM